MRNIAIENLVIDGESDAENQMSGCDSGKGFHAPFAIFSPDLQRNVGGPYASFQCASDALKAIQRGKMIPYTDAAVTWTIKGKPSRWYDAE